MKPRALRRYFLLALVLAGAAFGGHRLYAQHRFKGVSTAVIAKRALTEEEKALYLEGLRALPTVRLFDLEDYIKVDAAYVAALFEDALKTRGADQWSAEDIEKLAQWGGRFQQAGNHLLAGHCFEKCITFSPVDRVPKDRLSQWHLFAGQNLKLAGLDEEAIGHLKQAVTLNPKDYRVQMLLATTYAERFGQTASLSDLMLAYKYAEASLLIKPDQPRLEELRNSLAQRVAEEASGRKMLDPTSATGPKPKDGLMPEIPVPVPNIPYPNEPEPGPTDARGGFKVR